MEPVDRGDLDFLDSQLEYMQKGCSVPFALATFLIGDWNRELTPWEAPPVFGKEGFGQYYWGDSFTRSKFYSRTDVGYNILQHKNVNLDTKLTFNFTNKGMQWHQMLTLRFNLNGEYHVPSKKFYCTD